MTGPSALEPPEPVDRWLPELALAAGPVARRGDVAFAGGGEPWSTARRFAGGVQLEWSDCVIEVTAEQMIVDASRPRDIVELYWNTLVATVLELRGVTCLHGFMVTSPTGEGLAVFGNSGAGKTTTGRALVRHGCTLVCDDLVTLTAGGRPVGRPFLRRLPEPGETAALDIGGKIREPHLLSPTIPTLARGLCLDAAATSTSTLAPMEAVDQLLRNPYVPFDISAESASRRLADVVALIGSATILSAKPRALTPDGFAGLLLNDMDAA